MSKLKQVTILHSNDLHGDFLAEEVDKQLIGGVAMLSGYIAKARAEQDNVIYTIAGDMFRGSVIDSEFKGVSTIDIMNVLAPDVVGLGNHELDYGLAHLLFLEKCAKFPIINANLYIRHTGTRLFEPHYVIKVNGVKILFIGIVTEAVMDYSKKDELLGTFIDVYDAAEEIGRIINSYKTEDIGFTVLVTHIGLEEDKLLASILPPELGVDVIIGGHSHSFMEQPEIVNNILIVQAGIGTKAIGRFDISIDTKTNSVADYTWQMIPINSETCPVDEEMQDILENYKRITDDKYNKILSSFNRVLTHPCRNAETELGNLFADAISKISGESVVLIGSGSIRCEKLGRIVTLQNLKEAYPFGDQLYCAEMYGRDLRQGIQYMLREERLHNHTEFYQIPSTMRVVYDAEEGTVTEFLIDGKEVEDDTLYSFVMQAYHYNNISTFLNIPEERILRYDHPKMISTSDFDLVEEYFRTHPKIRSKVDGRITIVNQK